MYGEGCGKLGRETSDDQKVTVVPALCIRANGLLWAAVSRLSPYLFNPKGDLSGGVICWFGG
jgi:hypothetical protein